MSGIANKSIGRRVGAARGMRGFTMMELMITVAIVAFLAAIAIPAYNNQVRKTRRADAKSNVMEIVQALERAHTLNNTYIGPNCATLDRVNFYTITCTVQTATAFTVSAVPTGDQTNDTECGTLSITQTGARAETGTGTVQQCF